MSSPDLLDNKLPPIAIGQNLTEEAWIKVIQEMERVYSDMVQHQIELELKNKELEEANSFISNILLSMNEVLMVYNRQGEIMQTNASMVKLTGQMKSDILATPVLQYFDPASQKLIRHTFSGKPLSQAEMEIKGKSAWLPLLVNCSPMRDRQGGFLGMVLVGHEISDLRRAHKRLAESHFELQRTQEQLVQSEKMASLGRLVAGVAHELNNPVSFIYGNTHALERYAGKLSRFFDQLSQQVSDPAVEQLMEQQGIRKILSDLPSLLEGSQEGVERIRDIVLDLRQFSAGEKQEFAEFDLCHSVRTAVQWLAAEDRIKINMNLPGQLMVEGLSGRIHQVIMNLIQNAHDALSQTEQPEIYIELVLNDDTAQLRIQDNGPGIPEDILPRIFEPFFTTKLGKGTGLGLSLSYNFVVQHHGELSASNLSEGGTRFQLKLPLKQAADSSETSRSEK